MTKNQNRFAIIVALLITLFVMTMLVMGTVFAEENPTNYTVLSSYNLTHLNGSTTKLEFIKYATSSRVLAWTHRDDVSGDKVIRIGVFSTKKVGKKQIPVVDLYIFLHEFTHDVEFQYIPVGSSVEQIEKRAYDYTNLVDQIFDLQKNKQIIIKLNI